MIKNQRVVIVVSIQKGLLFINLVLRKRVTPIKKIKLNQSINIDWNIFFSFGNELITIDNMYNIIQRVDFSENPTLQQKLLRVFIKNILVLPINMRPSIQDSNLI